MNVANASNIAQNNHSRWLFCAFFILGLFLMGYGLMPTSHLLIQAQHQQCYWAEQGFTLKWRHSVEKKVWQEVYQQQNHQIVLIKTFMQTFGAGVPSQGTTISAPDGYVGFRSNVTFSEINWVVSRNMQGEIWGENIKLPIYQYVDDYTVVHIQLKRQPRLFWLFTERCDEKY